MIAILLSDGMRKLPKNVTTFTDRSGRTRYRFRKVGLPVRYIQGEPGTDEFAVVLAEARLGVPPPVRPRRQPAQPKPGQVVYFVACGAAVKIGTSTKLARRLDALATGAPERVELLVAVPGGTVLERTFHRRFAEWRLQREWFRRSPEIEGEVAALLANGGTAELANIENGTLDQ